MPISLYVEFLIPLLIGIACLVFSMRILFRSDAHNKTSEDISEYEDLDIPMHSTDENLEPGRKAFYVILFAGLGAASIVFGFAALHPVLSYVAKGIIVLTIIGSMVINARVDKKLQKEQDKQTETEQEQAKEAEAETDA